MSLPEPREGRCNEELDEGYCANYPVKDDGGKEIHGKCYAHDPDEENEGLSIPKKHGIHTNRSSYYQELPPEEQMWVDEVKDSFMEDAPFGEEKTGKVEIVRQTVIDLHKVRRANSYIEDEGLAQLQTVDTTQDGREIKDYVENILNLSVDRLHRSCNKRLKELGIFEGPSHDAAEGVQSLAEILAESDSDVEENDESEGGEE